MVSAWAAGLRLVLAQTKVDEKSNEISAIPQVLKLLDIHGCIVTLDAMGCQHKIAQQIIEQGGDYILGLKGNQGNTLEAVKEHFSTIPETCCEIFSEVNKGHGRLETRTYLGVTANSIPDLKEWTGLNSVIKVISIREIKGLSSTEERFYLCSMEAKEIQKIGLSVRSHWGVENSLHYVLDVTFKQDASRIRTGNAPENMGVLRHIALNILRQAPQAKKNTPSIKLKRKRAAMDNDYLEQIMIGASLEKA
jgi:predicted transposase YbfD/YdcC